MAVNIVTGMTGIEHITSHDDRARNASQFGRGKYVFDIGHKFSASIIDDNLIRIQDGMCINQGTQMGIEPNDYADVEIDNGLLGTNRHDIIVMRYEKNEETLLEKASLAVVKGVNSSEPVDPEVTEGNILDGGDLVDDMPLYRVVIEGVNLVSIEPLFEVFDGDVGSILEELEDKVDKVTGKGLSTNDYTNEDKAKVDGIPTKTSDLENDSDFVSDADYVHTDNNYTNADKEDVAKIDNLEHSLSLTSTATGNPISISDSAHVNAEELTVELEPKQDLHGYDKPWVGGAGKNKLVYPYVNSSQTVSGVTFTIQDDGTVNINGTATATISFVLADKVALDSIGSGDYILNGCAQGGATDGSTYFLGFYAPGKSKYDFGSGTTISLSGSEDASTNVYIRINNGYTAINLVFKPMIRLATETDPTFAPYSNICPISGYDSTSVVRSGKNLFDKSTISDNTWLDGDDAHLSPNSNTYTTDYIKIYNGKSVFIPGTGTARRFVFDVNKENPIFLNNSYNQVYTPTADGYLRVSCVKDVVSADDLQIEYGNQATTYEPYTADTYTLQFGDTLYGAEVDFVRGVATVTKGYIAEYAGETLPSTWISDRDVYASGTTPTRGAQVVYELATPYTIQLTPQQIKMLKGNNVLVADGDMDLVYQEDSVVGDVKEWAENEFLPKSSATAQHNYSTQEQVVGTWIDGSTLYEKTYICACDNTSNVQNVISFTDERVKIVSDAYFMNSLGHQIRMWWGGTLFWDYVIANGVVSVKRETVDSDWQSDVTFVVTIQYTKTTV